MNYTDLSICFAARVGWRTRSVKICHSLWRRNIEKRETFVGKIVLLSDSNEFTLKNARMHSKNATKLRIRLLHVAI